MTERFCSEIVEERAPALAMMWLSEPDYTGHHSPLGSPQHRARDRGGRRQCAPGVRDRAPARSRRARTSCSLPAPITAWRPSPRRSISTGLLIDAGLKAGPDSARCRRRAERHRGDDLFRRSRGRTAARGVARFSRPARLGRRVFAGDGWRRVGLPTDTAMRVAVSARLPTTGSTRMASPGLTARSCSDPADSESKIGFGQHGGLGPDEQRPFLIDRRRRFRARASGATPSSLIDIAPTVLRHLHMDHDDMDGSALPQTV